jgi:hypothetical protein
MKMARIPKPRNARSHGSTNTCMLCSVLSSQLRGRLQSIMCTRSCHECNCDRWLAFSAVASPDEPLSVSLSLMVESPWRFHLVAKDSWRPGIQLPSPRRIPSNPPSRSHRHKCRGPRRRRPRWRPSPNSTRVKKGHNPGIYTTWKDCKFQVWLHSLPPLSPTNHLGHPTFLQLQAFVHL